MQCFIQPGNDDEAAVGDLLRQSDAVVNPEGRIGELPDGHVLVSAGYANQTPWDCPRDLPEAELGRRLDEILKRLPNAERAIFNLHCPPYNTGLDEAPKLDGNLRPILHAAGQTLMVPVGSTSVRRAIEVHQPAAGLHGHVHECRGVAKLGRTVCINPGSRYNEGILQGVLMDLAAGRVQNYQLTSG